MVGFRDVGYSLLSALMPIGDIIFLGVLVRGEYLWCVVLAVLL